MCLFTSIQFLKPQTTKTRAECVIGVGGECSWAHSKVIFLLQLPRILELKRLLRENSLEWVTDSFLTTAGMLETPECLPCPTCLLLIQLLVDKDTFCFRAPSIYFYSLCLRFCSGAVPHCVCSTLNWIKNISGIYFLLCRNSCIILSCSLLFSTFMYP